MAGEELFVPLAGLIDVDLERTRLQREIDRLNGALNGVRQKLTNADFINKAPKDVVEREREKLQSMTMTLEKLQKNLDMFR